MKIMIKQLAIIAIIITSIYAQFPGDPRDPGDHRDHGMQGDSKDHGIGRREKIEELRIWKMTTFLDLSTEQAMQFFPILKDHEKKMFKIMKKQQEEMQALSEKCSDENYNPSDKEIEELMTQWNKVGKQLEEEKTNFVLNDLNFLTNQQKVKYIVFDSRFKSHLLRALREHKQK